MRRKGVCVYSVWSDGRWSVCYTRRVCVVARRWREGRRVTVTPGVCVVARRWRREGRKVEWQLHLQDIVVGGRSVRVSVSVDAFGDGRFHLVLVSVGGETHECTAPDSTFLPISTYDKILSRGRARA